MVATLNLPAQPLVSQGLEGEGEEEEEEEEGEGEEEEGEEGEGGRGVLISVERETGARFCFLDQFGAQD